MKRNFDASRDQMEKVPAVKLTPLSLPYHHFEIQHDLKVHKEVSNFNQMAKACVSTLTERIYSTTMDTLPPIKEPNSPKNKPENTAEHKPLGTLPGVTEPVKTVRK